jgi:hypothetical protein
VGADRGWRMCHECGRMWPIETTLQWVTVPRGDGTIGYIGPFCDDDCISAYRSRATASVSTAVTTHWPMRSDPAGRRV